MPLIIFILSIVAVLISIWVIYRATKEINHHNEGSVRFFFGVTGIVVTLTIFAVRKMIELQYITI